MRRFPHSLSAVTAMALFGSQSLAANTVITTCDLGQGYAYYAAGGLVTADRSGWHEDGFSTANGQVTLLWSGAEFDLILKDVVSTRSPREDGGTVLGSTGALPNSYAILVTYGQGPTIESYMFLLDEKGSGQVLWTSSRIGVLGPKAGAYVGSCHK